MNLQTSASRGWRAWLTHMSAAAGMCLAGLGLQMNTTTAESLWPKAGRLPDFSLPTLSRGEDVGVSEAPVQPFVQDTWRAPKIDRQWVMPTQDITRPARAPGTTTRSPAVSKSERPVTRPGKMPDLRVKKEKMIPEAEQKPAETVMETSPVSLPAAPRPQMTFDVPVILPTAGDGARSTDRPTDRMEGVPRAPRTAQERPTDLVAAVADPAEFKKELLQVAELHSTAVSLRGNEIHLLVEAARRPALKDALGRLIFKYLAESGQAVHIHIETP